MPSPTSPPRVFEHLCVLCRNFKDRDIDDVERIWVLFFGDCATPPKNGKWRFRTQNLHAGHCHSTMSNPQVDTPECRKGRLELFACSKRKLTVVLTSSWSNRMRETLKTVQECGKSKSKRFVLVCFMRTQTHLDQPTHPMCVFHLFFCASGPTAWARASLPWESSRLSIRAIDRWSVAVAWFAFRLVLRCVISKDDYVAFARKTWMFIDPESTKGNCNELWTWECCESPEWQQIKDSAIESTCANVRNPACQCSRCKTCFPKAPTTLTRLVTQTKNRSLLYVDYDCTHLYPTDFERCADKHAVATWLEKGGTSKTCHEASQDFSEIPPDSLGTLQR